jgi:hypothetical protein
LFKALTRNWRGNCRPDPPPELPFEPIHHFPQFDKCVWYVGVISTYFGGIFYATISIYVYTMVALKDTTLAIIAWKCIR